MQSNTAISQSPSFDTYSSSNRLALIAARVVHEFQPTSDLDDYLFNHQTYTHSNPNQEDEKMKIIENHQEEEEEEFEFASSSDQIIYNGQIRPSYPLFNTKLLDDNDYDGEIDRNSNSLTILNSPVRLPLRKLFNEERERESPSCSSSEADELDRVPAEMYCVWKPKTAPENCKKSNSTGSSKRWKFRDLLRSNSEGKDSFVFLTNPIKKRDATTDNKMKKSEKEGVRFSGKVKAVSGEVPVTLEYRLRNEKVKESSDGRRYHKNDIVGMLANVNGVSRNLHPF